MKVLVTGGRDYNDREMVYATLDAIHAEHGIEWLLHGAARGADELAWDWANERLVSVHGFPADWKKYGRSAGMIRNRKMLDEKPDLVVAFPGGRGTKNTVNLAIADGVTVVFAGKVAT